ncbi:hypothetical protein BO71DRAFT_289055, partial [Aspergillus ellipticus CBS 707.79]
HHPPDFVLALQHTPSTIALSTLLHKPGCTPRFLYDALMLPTVLKYFLDVPQDTDMTTHMMQATLQGYKLYQADPSDSQIHSHSHSHSHSHTQHPPIMLPSSDPEDAVEGMLVFGLDGEQRNAIYEVESGLLELVDVRVRVRVVDEVEGWLVWSERGVDAGAFVGN